ncbi:MAG: antitoxin Xre/MbcA/ParS toxin-binding domain-containing protein [Chitinophagaceae bacterium]
MGKAIEINEKQISYNAIDDKDILSLIQFVKDGFRFSAFTSLTKNTPFSLNEWSYFLNMSERTMQRYKKEKKVFDPIYSEKILEVMLLYKLGVNVFGTKEKFIAWIEAKNLALGGAKPKEFLDNTFGISFLKDELTRIEHGILA